MSTIDEIMKLVTEVVNCELDVEGWWGLPSDAVKLAEARAALLAEVRRLTAEADAVRRERDELVSQNAELAARLAEIEAQEPVAWEYDCLGWEPVMSTYRRDVNEFSPTASERPLYARPAPAQAAPERAEPAAWVPVHPREGALWSMTTATPSDERLPSHYPLSPLYTSPAPAAAPDGWKLAVRAAVSAIYFADSADYLGALWDVVRALRPDLAELMGRDDRAAWLAVQDETDQAATPERAETRREGLSQTQADLLKQEVNTVACLSVKSERHAQAIRVKRLINAMTLPT